MTIGQPSSMTTLSTTTSSPEDTADEEQAVSQIDDLFSIIKREFQSCSIMPGEHQKNVVTSSSNDWDDASSDKQLSSVSAQLQTKDTNGLAIPFDDFPSVGSDMLEQKPTVGSEVASSSSYGIAATSSSECGFGDVSYGDYRNAGSKFASTMNDIPPTGEYCEYGPNMMTGCNNYELATSTDYRFGSRMSANSSEFDEYQYGTPCVKDELVTSPEQMFTGNSGGEQTVNSLLLDLDPDSLEVYRNLILRQLVQDISTTCRKLAISSDPTDWTASDSARWLDEMAGQFGLERVHPQLHLPGRVLGVMTSGQFAERSPDSGETLHAQLQIWKTASEHVVRHEQKSSLSLPSICLPTPATPPIHHFSMALSPASSSSSSTWTTPMSSLATTPTSPPFDTVDNGPQLTLGDWLERFDPTANNYGDDRSSRLLTPTTATVARVRIKRNGAGVYKINGGSKNHRSASNIQNNAHLSRLLPSPAGSDSGISADYNDPYAEGVSSSNCGRHPTPPLEGRVVRTTTGHIHLWQFIRELLDAPVAIGACVRWLDRREGVFKIENSHHLARLWGQRKNRTKMNYDKLSRSLRQYYKKNIIRKTGQRQRLIYQFLPPYHVA